MCHSRHIDQLTAAFRSELSNDVSIKIRAQIIMFAEWTKGVRVPRVNYWNDAIRKSRLTSEQ